MEGHLASWMQFGKELSLALGRHMRVYLRRCDGAVPKQGLYVPNIHPGLQKRGGKGVAEHVRRCAERRCQLLLIFPYDPPHRLLGKSPAAVIQEQDAGTPDPLAKLLAVDPRQLQDFRHGNLNHPLLFALSINQESELVLFELNCLGG